jgi:hypothetical protein
LNRFPVDIDVTFAPSHGHTASTGQKALCDW